ncbi:MAG: L-rhamnose mutarotase [Planctomycetes bacterium]|nr:L-rhamnose mutarotase [Planctomycetota bacterium]
MKRYGSVIRLRENQVDEYRRLHAEVPPAVLATIRACNLRNYSIFVKRLDDGEPYLFAYFEYTGSDFAADQRKLAADPATQAWWKLTAPCQEPLASRAEGEWWATMDEVFHCD